MTLPTLRPDQQALKNAVNAEWRAGNRNVCMVLPTGGGKSVVMLDIAKDWTNQNAPIALVAHRQELVGQLSMHAARFGIRHRLVTARDVAGFIANEHRREFGKSFVDPQSFNAIVSVDTLISRSADLDKWCKQIRFWAIDEAHHVLRENKWGEAVNLFPNAYGLGPTATPQRADGKGIGRHHEGVFDAMVTGPTMRQLIDTGSLTEYQIVVPASDHAAIFDNLRITPSGDYSPKAMREASQQSQIVGDVVNSYIQYAFGKRGITFATDVETAQEIAAKFQQYGISAVAVSAKTPDATRAEYIRRFREGTIRQLVNVDLFGEGFDLPAIEVVSMARPTASLAVYLQQFGRALRVLADKAYGLVIDHVSNVKRHGLPDKPRVWTLDRRDKRASRPRDPDEEPIKICSNPAPPICARAYPATERCCPYCGYVPVPIGAGRSIEQVDGDLLLLSADVLAQMRAAIELEQPGDIAVRAGYAAGIGAAIGAQNRQIDRIETQKRLSNTIALWAGYQRAQGRPDSESYRRFYFGTGMDVLSALALPRVEMEKLNSTLEEWISNAVVQ